MEKQLSRKTARAMLCALMLSAFSCARSDFDAQLAVRVVEKSVNETEDGVASDVFRPVNGAAVYVVSIGNSLSSITSSTDRHHTNDAGSVTIRGLEGYYNVGVDVNGDFVIDAYRNRVPTGSSIELVVKQAPASSTETTLKDDEKTKDEDVISNVPPPTLTSISINGGVTEATTYFAQVEVIAENATFLELTENLASPRQRIPFQSAFGYQLSFGQGFKTLYAYAFNDDGEFAGPVSATITVKTHTPYPPVLPLLFVQANAPGSDDFLTGLPGAVEPGYRVRAYANTSYSKMLTEGVARSDGSFGPLNLRDGSVAGNVDFGDLVYITNTDPFNRESAAVWVVNDSTPPIIGKVDGFWQQLYLPNDIGARGETFHVTYDSISDARASDIAGGKLYFPPFGPNAPIIDIPANPPVIYSVEYTIPNDLFLDAAGPITATIWDAAFNSASLRSLSGTESKSYLLNSKPPEAVTMATMRGGNRRLEMRWADPNVDGLRYDLIVENELGDVVHSETIDWMRYMCLTSEIQKQAPSVWHPNLACAPTYPTLYIDWTLDTLANCHWYEARVMVTDMGLNQSVYSGPVSALVIIPPPSIEAWGGLADPSSGHGTIYYRLGIPLYTSSGELDFAPTAGAPYNYNAPSGVSSPMLFTSLPTGYKTPAISGLEIGTDYYLSARAFDGGCASDYANEISANTSLRVLSYSDGATDARLGGALARLRDVDGDLTDDVVIGSPGAESAAVVTAESGKTISELGEFSAPLDYNLPGMPIAVIDIDGNGQNEVLIGSPLKAQGALFLAGEVRLIDLAGNTIATFEGDAEGLQYGYTIANLGDLNADGISDFAISGLGCAHHDCLWDAAGPQEGPGRVDVYDGATRSLIVRHTGIAGDFLGASIASGFDVDDDGVADYVLGAPAARGHEEEAYIKVVSGAGGGAWTLSTPSSGARFGSSVTVATIGGIPYVFVGSISSSASNGGFVQAFRYLAGNWVTAWQFADSFAGSGFGASVAVAPKVSKDSKPDLLVGAPGQLQSYSYGAGGAYVFDAASGKLHFEVRGAGYDGGVGYSILPLGDMNGLINTEWMVAAPGSAHNGYNAGRVYIFTTDP